MNKNKIALLFLVLLNLCAYAQEDGAATDYLSEPMEEKSFDQEAWLTAKEGIDFKDEVRVDRYDEDFSDEEGEEERQRQLSGSSGESSAIWGFLFKALLVIGAIALLGFLLNQFIGSGGISFRRNRKIDNQPVLVDLEKVEAELIESDVDRMLRLALDKKNFPLALRLKYLAAIKALYLNGYTRWKKDKTNRQYIREIESPERKAEFRKLTLAFERIWYGRGEINQEEFDQIAPAFSEFIEKIEANPVTVLETN